MKNFNLAGILGGVWLVTMIIFIVAYIMAPEQQESLQAAQEEQERIAAQEERFFEAPVNTGKGVILVDKETGVCYYYVKVYNSGGMTVLVDASGNPVIWEEGEP